MSVLSHAKCTLATSTLLIGALLATVASAQQPQEQDEGGLAEIVVTAQKREQNLQDVPIAVSVVSGDLAESSGGFNIEALKQLVPTLNLRKTNTSLNQSLFLRGVGTINFAIAAQPSVATVLDGVVLTSAGEAFGDLYDIERIEVLRGPQGTLFGKNASAGVLNIVSKRPSANGGGYIDVGFYEDDEYRVKATLDAPISDKLRTRTTATWGQFDGYIDNITIGPARGTINGYERKGFRTVWEADPTDTVRLTFIGDLRKSNDDCCVEIIGNRPTANVAAVTSLLSGTQFAGDESRSVKQNLVMRSEEEAWGVSLQADIEIGALTLTSITAYRTWDATEIREGDWIDQPAPYPGNAFAQLHDFGPQSQDTLSQELRIASASGGFLEYVAGLYYSKTDAERFFRRDTIVCSATTLPADATGLTPCRTGASTFVTPSANALFGADFENIAAFADGTFNVSDRFRVIAGLRWTQDDLSFQHRYNFSPIAGPGIRNQTGGGTATLSGSNSSDNVSGRAGLQFEINDDYTTYLTYSRGYKGPAYNVFFNMTANNAPVIEAETADSLELGLKSQLFDGRVIVNAAAFYAKYKDFQANNFLFLNNTLITTLTNAGDVTTGGVEIDVLARPTDRFSLSGGFTYNEARVDSLFVPPGQTPAYPLGIELPFAPKYKGSLMAEYRIPAGRYEVTPGLVASYQDAQFTELATGAQMQQTRIGGYGTVDFNLALTRDDERFRVALVGRNITNESFAALLTRGGPGGALRYQIPREADRYFGIQARVNFGAK